MSIEPEDDEVIGLGIEDELDEEPDLDESIEKPVRPRNSPCPVGDHGHHAVPNPKKRHSYDVDYICEYCDKSKWTNKELEELIADVLLREDANRELCRQCLAKDPNSIPYGTETGNVEYAPILDKEGNGVLDENGDLGYSKHPELRCEKGHRWYFGEGPRRDTRGQNPILFESHLYNRKRRELLAKEGVVDPAYTMDRWGKRPTVGLYGRSHPQGRKINSPKQRRDHGAGFTSSHRGLMSLPVTEIGTHFWYYKSDHGYQAMLHLQPNHQWVVNEDKIKEIT